jgi:uncharacterized membrane protein YeaQ/YmgE (transglycosylase-associated protein family)
MDLTDLLLTVLLAIICGTVAQLTSGYSRGGWIVNMGLGFLGGLAGIVAARTFNAPLVYNLKVKGTDYPVIYALIGCVFFLATIGLIIKPGRH